MTTVDSPLSADLAALDGRDLAVADLLHDTPQTRADLQEGLGLSRTALAARLERLSAAGLVRESRRVAQSGGRPARLLELNTDIGVIAAVDISESHSQVAVCSLTPQVLVSSPVALELADGPETILEAVLRAIQDLLATLDQREERLLCIGLALPAPVDFESGIVSGYSVLHDWDGYKIRDWFATRTNAHILVENDVNAMAVAEKQLQFPQAKSLFFVKAGTGIGSAIIMNGALYRGAQGAAGDIGHIRLNGHGEPLCRCGNRGCLEALTAGWAVARDLIHEGMPVKSTEGVVALAKSGNIRALQALREGGRLLGEAVAHATSLLNPEVIVIGGSLAAAGGLILSGVRQMVYERALPLATRRLELVPARAGRDAAVLGVARLAVTSWLRGDFSPFGSVPSAANERKLV